jgi:hypothetical protein
VSRALSHLLIRLVQWIHVRRVSTISGVDRRLDRAHRVMTMTCDSGTNVV